MRELEEDGVTARKLIRHGDPNNVPADGPIDTLIPGAAAAALPEGASCRGDTQDGFALLAVGWFGDVGSAAGLVVKEDGLDHRLHVAAHAGAIVVKFLDHAIEVIARWMTGHQALDELAANERSDVWMIEELIVRGGQLLRRESLIGGIIILRGNVGRQGIDRLPAQRRQPG